MPIDPIALEKAIKRAIPVTHLEIQDQSSGCGDSYRIVLVSEAFEGQKNNTSTTQNGERGLERTNRTDACFLCENLYASTV